MCNSSRIRKQSKFKSTRKIKDRGKRERERENFLTTYQTFHPFATNDSAEDIEREIDTEREKERETFAPSRANRFVNLVIVFA